MRASSKSPDGVRHLRAAERSSYFDSRLLCLSACLCENEWKAAIIPGAWSFLPSLSIKKGGICIAQSLKIPHNPKLEDYDKAIQQLLETHYSRAVIIFANEEDIRWAARRWCCATFGFLIMALQLLESCFRHRYAMHARQTHLWQKQI